MSNSTNETGEHELKTTEIDIEEIDSGQNHTEPPPVPPAAKVASVPPDIKPSSKPKSTGRESARSSAIESKLSSIKTHSKPSTSKPPKPPQPSKSLKPAATKSDTRRQPEQTQDDKTLPESPQVIDARKIIGLCKHELTGQVDDQRAARLHYEIASFYESYLDDNQSASEHYQHALRFEKDHRPSILGARRTLINARKFQAALPFFDEELPLISDPSNRAQLMLAKGLVLEHELDQRDQALKVYTEALELDSTNLNILRAAGRCQLLTQGWDSLDQTYQRMASLLEDDPNYRAAVIAERARLFDVHKQDPAQAAQLYEAAISLDPDTPGALEALKRLSHTQSKWLQLVSSLEQESTRSLDPEVRAAAQLNIAHLQIEKLGNTNDGIAALENAFRNRPPIGRF